MVVKIAEGIDLYNVTQSKKHYVIVPRKEDSGSLLFSI